MKFEYDPDVDAAYIYLEDSINNNEVAKTIELDEKIILDFNADGKLIGIELLDASTILNNKSLASATILSQHI